MQEQQQQAEFVANVYSPQLAKKIGAPAPLSSPNEPGPQEVRRRAVHHPDTWLAWCALPNEYIVPIGRADAEPVLGGTVSKLLHRGVLRFPSSIQRIAFRTDNVSAENQGVLVEGWACWRVADPKVAYRKLDFSDPADPMGRTNQTLGVQCAGIMKGLISVKSVAELLKRREDLIDALHKKLAPTEERWGISFDEIGISEVQVLSQDVFDNMQRPFRNEAREVAATSDLETAERIARKTSEQHGRVAKIEAEGEQAARELRARSETAIRDVELSEEGKRVQAEQRALALKAEEEARVRSRREQLERELQRQRALAEQEAALAAIAAEEERALRQRRAEEAQAAAGARLAAEREAAEIAARREIEPQRRALAEEQVEIERALAAVRAAARAEERAAAAVARREEAHLEADLAVAQWERERDRERQRLELAERQREIDGRLSEAEIRMRAVAALPEVAKHVRIGDVRWYGPEAPGALARAVEEVLDVARAHGVDVSGLLRREPGA